MRLPKGPAPRRLVPIREEMNARGEIAIQKKELFGYFQSRIVPLRKPNLSGFTADQLALVDKVIEALWGHSASLVSDVSHQRAWRITRDGETIPYEAALLSDDNLTDCEINRVRELNAVHEWE